MIPRNSYAVSKGDVLVGAVFTVQQLRNQYDSNGGPLNERRRRFLRRFIPAYANPQSGGGLATEFAVMIPLSVIQDKAPASVRQALRNRFEIVTPEWLQARPWIYNEANAIDPVTIDGELGTEYQDNLRNSWES